MQMGNFILYIFSNQESCEIKNNFITSSKLQLAHEICEGNSSN